MEDSRRGLSQPLSSLHLALVMVTWNVCFTLPSPHHTLTTPPPHHTTPSLHHTLTTPHPHYTTPSPHHPLTTPHPHHPPAEQGPQGEGDSLDSFMKGLRKTLSKTAKYETRQKIHHLRKVRCSLVCVVCTSKSSPPSLPLSLPPSLSLSPSLPLSLSPPVLTPVPAAVLRKRSTS